MSENQNQSISFILPVLNAQKYISDCLDHIIREKSPDDEIIVVDNGSTDDTLSILARYPAVRLLHAPQMNIGAARNRGAAIAKGDIFAFIDSDCLLSEGWRSAVMTTLEDESVAATGSRYDLPTPAHWIEKAWYSKKRRTAGPAKYINSGNLIVRRGAFEAVSGFNDEMITDEDYDIGQRLQKAGFLIWENPDVSVVHMGNAKSLAHFYRKERWHAASSLHSTLSGNWDRPTAMTVVFIFTSIIALAMIPFALSNPMIIIAIALTALFAPLITAIFRVWQYRNFRYFFQLVVLYAVFFLSRTSIIAKFVYKNLMLWSKTESKSSLS